MPKTLDNNGVVRIIKAIRGQSQRIFDLNSQQNMLGTMTATGVYIDAIEDEIPRRDFLFLKLRNDDKPVSGDRVVCLPVGDTFVILGKVE